jgi:hypothetical protein
MEKAAFAAFSGCFDEKNGLPKTWDAGYICPGSL